MFCTPFNRVVALDPLLGREIWPPFDPKVDRAFTAGAANGGVCCGILNRGLALDEGKVIVPVLDRRLMALWKAAGSPGSPKG